MIDGMKSNLSCANDVDGSRHLNLKTTQFVEAEIGQILTQPLPVKTITLISNT